MVPVPRTPEEAEAHNRQVSEQAQRDYRFAQRDALLNVAARKAARLSFAPEITVSLENLPR